MREGRNGYYKQVYGAIPVTAEAAARALLVFALPLFRMFT